MARDATMTRKHFELIAHVINALDLKGVGAVIPPDEVRLRIAHDFSRCLEDVNMGFNREAFINACTQADRYRATHMAKRLASLKAGKPFEGTEEKLTKRAKAEGLSDFKPDDKLPEGAR